MSPSSFNIQTTPDDHRIAWLAALAICIHVFESAIPSPIPGLKPGLANIVTLIVLWKFGWRTAAWVSVLRVLVGSLVLGTFLSPTFMMSFAGALASLLVIGVAYQLPGKGFSIIGLSLLAAIAHILAQFVVAYALFIPHPAIWRLLPVLLTFAVLLGTVNGIISQNILKRIL